MTSTGKEHGDIEVKDYVVFTKKTGRDKKGREGLKKKR
jgi:hypothetical protein